MTAERMIVTASNAAIGQLIRAGGRLAVVSDVRDGRIFFRYIRNGQPSNVERNTGSAVAA